MSESPGKDLPEESSQTLISSDDFSKIFIYLRRKIGEALYGSGRWAIVGIKRRGAALARRMWVDLKESHPDIAYGEVDISLYRDDYHLREGNPQVLGSEIPFTVDETSIILIDDVLFTGRTIRAAMDLIHDFGGQGSVHSPDPPHTNVVWNTYKSEQSNDSKHDTEKP